LRDPLAVVFDRDCPVCDLLLADFDRLEPDRLDALRLLLPRAFDFALALVDRELLLLRLLRPELDGMLICPRLLVAMFRCMQQDASKINCSNIGSASGSEVYGGFSLFDLCCRRRETSH
jgi:hypothetical protein